MMAAVEPGADKAAAERDAQRETLPRRCQSLEQNFIGRSEPWLSIAVSDHSQRPALSLILI